MHAKKNLAAARLAGAGFFTRAVLHLVLSTFAGLLALAAFAATPGNQADSHSNERRCEATPDGCSCPDILTIRDSMHLGDNSYVGLRGRIVFEFGRETYLFQDMTGSIEVEIDDNVMMGRHFNPQEEVVVHGEVETDRPRRKIDVLRITGR